MSSLACCAGSLHTGQPSGSEVTLGGDISCYQSVAAETAEGGSGRVGIIIVTDVFGYRLPNVRLIADAFSQRHGFTCIIPDLFQGTEADPSLLDSLDHISSDKATVWQRVSGGAHLLANMVPFLLRNSQRQSRERIMRVLTAVHGQFQHLFLVGYCWGGQVVLQLASQEPALDFCGCCVVHPGALRLPQDLERLRKPICFCMPEFEMRMAKEDHDALRVQVAALPFVADYKVYANMHHGFAVRGDHSDPDVAAKAAEAFQDMVTFVLKCVQSK